jgi:hypothetical protein
MTNIIKLPDRPVREWQVLEKTLRPTLTEWFADSDLDGPEVVDYLLEKIRPVFMKYAAPEEDFISDRSLNMEQFSEKLNAWVLRLTAGYTFELVAREMEIYRLTREMKELKK